MDTTEAPQILEHAT
jgi:WD40 repeat protein